MLELSTLNHIKYYQWRGVKFLKGKGITPPSIPLSYQSHNIGCWGVIKVTGKNEVINQKVFEFHGFKCQLKANTLGRKCTVFAISPSLFSFVVFILQ